jgi:major type 1 subunit fimbrin (pilin)
MKHILLAAPMAVAMLIAAAPVAANTGTIQFAGQINAGSCPVEIVDPVSGGVDNIIRLGTAIVAEFGTEGAEAKERRFGMRITPSDGCTITPGDATVNFVSMAGAIGPGSALYALRPSSNSATGVAVVIKDARDNSVVAHGTNSKAFAVVANAPTTMAFTAAYKSIVVSTAITAGPADADVNFTVNLP